jgi:RNA polymerase sigma factor (sigma-70 family)
VRASRRDRAAKRRKSKDNPYTLIYNEIKNTYSVMFKDGENNTHLVEIKKEIFDAMDRFELDDLSEMNEYDNHIEHSEVKEITLNKRILYKQNEIDDIIQAKFESRELKRAISCLSDVQKRRIKLYYFEDKTIEEIAKLERTSHQAVSETIRAGIKNIRKMLKK